LTAAPEWHAIQVSDHLQSPSFWRPQMGQGVWLEERCRVCCRTSLLPDWISIRGKPVQVLTRFPLGRRVVPSDFSCQGKGFNLGRIASGSFEEHLANSLRIPLQRPPASNTTAVVVDPRKQESLTLEGLESGSTNAEEATCLWRACPSCSHRPSCDEHIQAMAWIFS
jgi:hypothetical protein